MAQNYFPPGFFEQEYRPKIEEHVDELLDSGLEVDDHIFLEEFAKPLPILIIAELLNMSSEKIESSASGRRRSRPHQKATVPRRAPPSRKSGPGRWRNLRNYSEPVSCDERRTRSTKPRTT